MGFFVGGCFGSRCFCLAAQNEGSMSGEIGNLLLKVSEDSFSPCDDVSSPPSMDSPAIPSCRRCAATGVTFPVRSPSCSRQVEVVENGRAPIVRLDMLHICLARHLRMTYSSLCYHCRWTSRKRATARNELPGRVRPLR